MVRVKIVETEPFWSGGVVLQYLSAALRVFVIVVNVKYVYANCCLQSICVQYFARTSMLVYVLFFYELVARTQAVLSGTRVAPRPTS